MLIYVAQASFAAAQPPKQVSVRLPSGSYEFWVRYTTDGQAADTPHVVATGDRLTVGLAHLPLEAEDVTLCVLRPQTGVAARVSLLGSGGQEVRLKEGDLRYAAKAVVTVVGGGDNQWARVEVTDADGRRSEQRATLVGGRGSAEFEFLPLGQLQVSARAQDGSSGRASGVLGGDGGPSHGRVLVQLGGETTPIVPVEHTAVSFSVGAAALGGVVSAVVLWLASLAAILCVLFALAERAKVPDRPLGPEKAVVWAIPALALLVALAGAWVGEPGAQGPAATTLVNWGIPCLVFLVISARDVQRPSSYLGGAAMAGLAASLAVFARQAGFAASGRPVAAVAALLGGVWSLFASAYLADIHRKALHAAPEEELPVPAGAAGEGVCPHCRQAINPFTGACACRPGREAEPGSAPLLVAEQGEVSGRSFTFTDQFGVGREPGNALVLRDPTVSRRHCLFTVGPEGAYVVDQGSANGTFVNSVRITRRLLRSGDLVKVGSCVFRFEWTTVQPEPASVGTPPSAAA